MNSDDLKVASPRGPTFRSASADALAFEVAALQQGLVVRSGLLPPKVRSDPLGQGKHKGVTVGVAAVEDERGEGVPASPPAWCPIWASGLKGKGQVVGVGDTGIRRDACALAEEVDPKAGFLGDGSTSQNREFPYNKVDPGRRKVVAYYTSGGDGVESERGHGTHVTGLVAGSPLASLPLATRAPTSAPAARRTCRGGRITGLQGLTHSLQLETARPRSLPNLKGRRKGIFQGGGGD